MRGRGAVFLAARALQVVRRLFRADVEEGGIPGLVIGAFILVGMPEILREFEKTTEDGKSSSPESDGFFSKVKELWDDFKE